MIFKMTISFVSFGIFTTQVSGRGEVEKNHPQIRSWDRKNCLRTLEIPEPRANGSQVLPYGTLCEFAAATRSGQMWAESYRLSRWGQKHRFGRQAILVSMAHLWDRNHWNPAYLQRMSPQRDLRLIEKHPTWVAFRSTGCYRVARWVGGHFWGVSPWPSLKLFELSRQFPTSTAKLGENGPGTSSIHQRFFRIPPMTLKTCTGQVLPLAVNVSSTVWHPSWMVVCRVSLVLWRYWIHVDIGHIGGGGGGFPCVWSYATKDVLRRIWIPSRSQPSLSCHAVSYPVQIHQCCQKATEKRYHSVPRLEIQESGCSNPEPTVFFLPLSLLEVHLFHTSFVDFTKYAKDREVCFMARRRAKLRWYNYLFLWWWLGGRSESQLYSLS